MAKGATVTGAGKNIQTIKSVTSDDWPLGDVSMKQQSYWCSQCGFRLDLDSGQPVPSCPTCSRQMQEYPSTDLMSAQRIERNPFYPRDWRYEQMQFAG